MSRVSVNLAEPEQQLPAKELREVVFDVKNLGVSYDGVSGSWDFSSLVGSIPGGRAHILGALPPG